MVSFPYKSIVPITYLFIELQLNQGDRALGLLAKYANMPNFVTAGRQGTKKNSLNAFSSKLRSHKENL